VPLLLLDLLVEGEDVGVVVVLLLDVLHDAQVLPALLFLLADELEQPLGLVLLGLLGDNVLLLVLLLVVYFPAGILEPVVQLAELLEHLFVVLLILSVGSANLLFCLSLGLDELMQLPILLFQRAYLFFLDFQLLVNYPFLKIAGIFEQAGRKQARSLVVIQATDF